MPHTIDGDVETLIGKGVAVYAMEEDLEARAVPASGLIGGVQVVSRSELAGLWDQHDSIWRWWADCVANNTFRVTVSIC